MNVCQKCGDKGDVDYLIQCVKCNDSAEHSYCMDKLRRPEDNFDWLCEDCSPKLLLGPTRKSDRLNLKNEVRSNRLEKRKLHSSPRTLSQVNKLPEPKQPVSDSCEKRSDLESELRPNELQISPNEEMNFVASNDPSEDKAFQSEKKVYAKQFTSPIWRGCFRIQKNGITFGVMAYVSANCSPKVINAASNFPEFLNIETLSRLNAWPKAFNDYPPTDDSIGLYIFPAYEKDEKVYDGLLDDIIGQDLALKAVINNVELLVFSSRELPEEHWRICRKYYLWGVCKRH